MTTVFISYTRKQPDQQLAQRLAESLHQSGHHVFLDTEISPGADWSKEIEGRLKDSQAFIVLVSGQSIHSQMVREEIRWAVERNSRTGIPKILSVNIGFSGQLPYEMGAHLNRFQAIKWNPDDDFAEITTKLCKVVSSINGNPEDNKTIDRTSPSEVHDTPPLEPIRWLHLSDLHLGCRGRELWWQMHDEFQRSILELLPKRGVPDLVLLTGDLTYSGDAKQFSLLDRFLDMLLGWVQGTAGGPAPLVIPVPGNHDLVRPEGRGLYPYRILDHYHDGEDNEDIKLLNKELWEQRDAAFLEPLFGNYCDWFRDRILPQFDGKERLLHMSHFPGDLCAQIHKAGKPPLCVVGLNSTWLQYSSGDFEGRLEIPTRQFHAALTEAGDDSPLEVLNRHRHKLLLMHHPPAWLSRPARQRFVETIYTSRYFCACLYGHMHQSRSEQIGVSGGQPRYYLQSPSLFGLERYGTSKERRAMGYSWGAMTAQGEIRIWPLVRVKRGGGEAEFDFDQSFSGDLDKGVVLRPADHTSPGPVDSSAPSITPPIPREPIDRKLKQYRQWTLERYSGVDLIGIGGGELRLDLDDIYVPLRISQRSPIADLERREKRRRRTAAEEQALGEIELEDVFRAGEKQAQRIAIFGDPGAGKTTALRKLLQLCINKGPEALALESGTVPVFLRLRKLTAEALEGPIEDFIGQELAEMSAQQFAPEFGRQLWQRSSLLLLLDGLDEIPDNALRARTCRFLERSLTGKRNIRAVVSSRYAGYGGDVTLGGCFMHLDVRPLDAAQVRAFINRWFAEACKAIGIEAEAQAKARQLIETLDGKAYASQRIKVLVSTPLLLTLLCLVVLRGREMPRRRTEFYRQCLEVLLSRWGKTEKAREPLLDLDTAMAVLRPLAYELHSDQRRDDLSRAEFVDLAEDRLETLEQHVDGFELLRWLHEQTGVIEEYAPNYYGFMHLGLQEYLSAVHIAGQGAALLPALVDHAGEKWWQEVFQLLVGLPNRNLFAPLMRLLLKTPDLDKARELIQDCMTETPEVDIEPLLELLAPEESPLRQATALRLLQGRQDPRIIEGARVLMNSPDSDVAALAGRFIEGGRPRIERREGFDVFVAYLPEEREQAIDFAKALETRDLRAWLDVEQLSDAGSWLDSLDQIVQECSAVAVLVGDPKTPPWSRREVMSCLSMFKRRKRVLLPVLLPGNETAPELPEILAQAEWIELREGYADSGLEMIADRMTREVRDEAQPIQKAIQPIIEKPFTEATTGIRFLWIPGGGFRMGSNDMSAEDGPAHSVRVSPFWLAETPVTNRQYGVFLESTMREEPRYWRDRRFSNPDQPVVGVNWDDAKAFCKWLSETTEKRVNLPSEAQWEFAARGTKSLTYPWGNDPPDDSRACYGLDWDTGKPVAVGSYPAGKGPFGTLDQAGNVWEWCLDVWDEKAYEKRKHQETIDPVVKRGDKTRRVLRGGSWFNPAEILQSAYRSWHDARDRSVNIGFRVAVLPASC